MKRKHIDWSQDLKCDLDLGHDLDLEFSRSNMELAISLPKMVRLPRNEKQTHQLNSRPQMWPSDLPLAKTLTMNFPGKMWNWLYLTQKWSDCHKTKRKHIDLNSRPQMWPVGLTLAMTLIFEFSRSYVILTIWWPRSGVMIYQIVTEVTSDVGVPSTHLVCLWSYFLFQTSSSLNSSPLSDVGLMYWSVSCYLTLVNDVTPHAEIMVATSSH